MLITCGINSIEGLKIVAQSGVDEVFCGVQDRAIRSPFLRILNRREMPGANLGGVNALKELTRVAKGLGVRVSVTLNEMFTAAQYGEVRRLLDALCTIPVDGLIISDFALLLLLYHEYGGRFVIHMGTGALSLNTNVISLYKKYGARRVVLSRKIFTHEIAGIIKKSNGIETEVFMEVNAFCPNFDGLCNYLHNNSLSSLTRCSSIENQFKIEPSGRPLGVINEGCKLCAIWDYARLGVTCMKVPARAGEPLATARLVRLIRGIEGLAVSLSKQEFVNRVKTEFYNVYSRPCAIESGCFLAREL
ncbi:MAG: U32 family peptidase [Deltaproteobacteria bacterium]|nr:U32 family peptidase [Deltaproteobacteria bacterium]